MQWHLLTSTINCSFFSWHCIIIWCLNIFIFPVTSINIICLLSRHDLSQNMFHGFMVISSSLKPVETKQKWYLRDVGLLDVVKTLLLVRFITFSAADDTFDSLSMLCGTRCCADSQSAREVFDHFLPNVTVQHLFQIPKNKSKFQWKTQ